MARILNSSAVLLTVVDRKPWADPESSRTKAMWDEYERFEFPVPPEDGEMLGSVQKLYIYMRKGA